MANYKGGYQIVELPDNITSFGNISENNKKQFSFLEDFIKDKRHYILKPVLIKFKWNSALYVCYPVTKISDDQTGIIYFMSTDGGTIAFSCDVDVSSFDDASITFSEV